MTMWYVKLEAVDSIRRIREYDLIIEARGRDEAVNAAITEAFRYRKGIDWSKAKVVRAEPYL